MTTATAPRIITSADAKYAIIDETTVIVVAGSHDFKPNHRSVSINNLSDGTVSLSAADGDRHATFYMSREEARLFAQAILDATA
jgi:hypothetical protein